jgi:hypothetical protein
MNFDRPRTPRQADRGGRSQRRRISDAMNGEVGYTAAIGGITAEHFSRCPGTNVGQRRRWCKLDFYVSD